MHLSRQDILLALQAITLPLSQQPASSALQDFAVKSNMLQIALAIGYPLMPYSRETLIQQIRSKFKQFAAIDVKILQRVETHAPQGIKGIAGIKNIIAIASGKGGVGKSTTAVNLALALYQAGATVGILDADIYGPNQPQLLGIMQKPELTADKKLLPVLRYGIQSMSMGYLVEANTPMVWRGPMISSALQQLLSDTAWGELDYLLVDLPPGTGDIQLTLAKKIPVAGAVIVTTPQDIALLDVRKALEMFNKTNVPVLGIIENMATHVCRSCGQQEEIFGVGGGARLAEQCQVPLLGQLPLDRAIRESGDEGEPIVRAAPDGSIALSYQQIAMTIAARLATQPKSYAHLFSNVVIERN